MMNVGEIAINVNCKMEITLEQATRALKLVEWFLNDHNDYTIQCKRKCDGLDEYSFVRMKLPDKRSDEE